MWRIDGSAGDPDRDLSLVLSAVEGQPDFFDTTRPIALARAPGRLDLMGGIADYSGSLVLELPLAVATRVAVQTCAAPPVVLHSPDLNDPDSVTPHHFSLISI